MTVNPAPPQDLDRDSEEFTARTVAPPPMASGSRDIDPGTTLNEYTIEGKIGEGGMGAVFSAVHPLIGKRAAVKVLRKELCEDPITLERFIDEARVVNQIGHPNIVDVFAFGTLPDGRSYFIMEWLKGESLRDRVARGHMNYLEAAAVLKALARALEAAHEKGIIHRDLKPDNVFLVEERGEVPRVKLLDFGIAKLVRQDQSVSRTATGAMIGTPQYVAPEQAKGHAIDARVDIYSLGCVSFELLTGRPPFVADNAMEMVAKHLMEAPPRPSQFDAGVPKELDELVSQMLSKNREERPSLTEIVATLDTLQKTPAPRRSDLALGKRDSAISLSVTRPVDVADLVAKEHARRRRRGVLGAIGLVLGGVATGAVAFMVVSSLKEPSDSKPEATPPAAEQSPPPAVEPAATPTTPAPPPAVTPDAAPAAAPPPVEAPRHIAPPPPVAHPPKKDPPKKDPPKKDPPKREPPPANPQIRIPTDDHGLMRPD